MREAAAGIDAFEAIDEMPSSPKSILQLMLFGNCQASFTILAPVKRARVTSLRCIGRCELHIAVPPLDTGAIRHIKKAAFYAEGYWADFVDEISLSASLLVYSEPLDAGHIFWAGRRKDMISTAIAFVSASSKSNTTQRHRPMLMARRARRR